jgi:transglutaminase-like putative cysteine protease
MAIWRMQNWKGALLLQCLVFFLSLSACNLWAGATDSFSIAPPAAWIDVQKNLNPETNSPDENVRYVLLDDQVNVSRKEHYHRIVEEPVNANGVQNCVQISLDYDPSYEHLVIHNIIIHRGTNILNRLEPEKIKVIQQERDLDMNIYNGEVSAVLFLDDVRVGDQIDYSYTTIGSNPIFAGHYLDNFQPQWAHAVTDERFRLLWPTNRFLKIKNHGTDIQPVVRQSGDVKEYLWELHDLPAIIEEDSLPSWSNAYPWVQFSEFSSWSEVARWAAKLYPQPGHLDPKLQEKVSQWEQSYPNPGDRLAAVLAFVQDEIRYMGIEVGPNSHQPNDPSLVFARRFGDCKDKAYLFCTLLHAMGIEATEALVDTENTKTVADWLPSPYAFNHVITQVRLNGKTYWLDSTELHQGGAIDSHFFPDYACCLLVQAGPEDLTAIPQQRAGWPRTTVEETFVVHGRKEPADFTVQTLAEGRDADQLRGNFADQGRQTLEKNYLNYYAHEYPKIKITKPLEVFDHLEQNTFETIEHYQIREFWTLSDDKQNYECDFFPQVIRDLFDEPTTTLRAMPLNIAYPCHEILRTKVILPEGWPLTNEVDHFESIAAQLDAKREIGTNTFQMEYEYQTLTNFVSANDMPAYLATLKKMKDALGYSLTWGNEDNLSGTKPATGGMNWTIIILGGIYVIFLLTIAVAVYRFQHGKPPLLLEGLPPHLSGLGGWLILVAIGVIINPIYILSFLAQNSAGYAPETWHNLTDPSRAAYNSWWAPLLIFELLANLTSTVFSVLLLIMFFQRRRTFPRLYVIYLTYTAITAIIDHFAIQLIPAATAQNGQYDSTLTRTFIACLIWIPYMLLSKRVKATFVR